MFRLKKNKTTIVPKPRLSAIVLLISVLGAETAVAQNNQISPLIGRIPAEFRSTPIEVNSFEITPVIDADVEYVDNLFVNSAVPVNDTILSIGPRLFIRDRRDDRQIALRLSSNYETFLDNSVNDRFSFDAVGSAKFGLGTLTRTSLGLNFRQNDTRGFSISDSEESVGQPLSLTSYGGGIGLDRDIGPFTIGVQGRYNATEYNGDTVINGELFESGFRDFETLTGIGRLSYSVAPNQKIYTQVVHNDVDFGDISSGIDLPDSLLVDRSSNDTSFVLGYTRQLTNLLELDLNAGYINQTFDNPDFSENDSFVFNASLLWEPTRLTTLQLSGARSVDTSNNPFLNGFLRTTGSLTVSHELRRNIVLDANVRYSDLSIANGADNGYQFATYGALRYYLSKRWSLRFRAEYLDQNTILFPGSQTRATAGLRYNF